jgi:uncharacterized protein YgiB involved in biofilm formation
MADPLVEESERRSAQTPDASVGAIARPRRSSLRVTLVLIGVAGLAACGGSNDPQMRRDTYASLADCRADWHREELCEPAPASSSNTTSSSRGVSGGTRYYGPVYRSSSTSSSAPSGSRAIGSTTVSRGGFGSSSSFHGASSS